MSTAPNRAAPLAHQFSTLTFTPAVAEVQTEQGSRNANQKLLERGQPNDILGPDERDFIARRDGFYLATTGETGWPYLQFRGGPPGFLHPLDGRTLAFADVTGNRQYISTGNLRANPRAAVFLMDYPHQARLKLLARVEILPWDAAPPWKSSLLLDPRARPERVVLLHLAAFDWNCPQHIPQRWTVRELAELEALHQNPLATRLRALEAEVAQLRTDLAAAQPPVASS